MSVCQTTPTATEFATVTTDSSSTSVSESVTTVPADITTLTTSSCPPASSGANSSCETTTIVSTISPEQVITTQVPIVVTFPVTLTTPTATLFSTSCSQTDGGSSISSTTPPPPSSTTTSSTSSSISTLPPVTSASVILSSSTLAGGSVIIVSSTITTVVTPTTAVPVTRNHSSTNVGAIVGGTVGGVAFLAILFLAIFFCLRKRHKDRDDDFDNVDGRINPFPIRLPKGPNKRNEGMTIDEPEPAPNPSTPSNGFASSIAPDAGLAGVGTGAAAAGFGSSVSRRTPTTTTDSFPNPYDEPQRNGVPPSAPTSDGSVLSESVYSQPSRFPGGLHVANPSEIPPVPSIPPMANLQQPIRMPVPVTDISSTSAYANTSDGGLDDPNVGTSSAPYVHHDAGPLRRDKADEARRHAEEQHEEGEVPPPAYEA